MIDQETELHASVLRSLREEAGVTQTAMAELMGVPFRTYQDLEGGRSKLRRVHVNAAMFGMLMHYASTPGARPPRAALAIAEDGLKRYQSEHG